MADSSELGTLVLGFVAVVIVLAVIAPWLIPFAANVFVFLFVDHIYGLVVGAIIGGIFGSLLDDIEFDVFGFTVSAGAVAGIILQYILFH
jgi:hypothetical protein